LYFAVSIPEEDTNDENEGDEAGDLFVGGGVAVVDSGTGGCGGGGAAGVSDGADGGGGVGTYRGTPQ